MRLNWNFAWLAMLAMIGLCAAGCSGINAGTSVSPATFLLPGIMKTDLPVTNTLVSLPETSREFALNK